MKILPGYYMIPLLYMIPNSFVIICRAIFKTSSHLKMIGYEWNSVIMLFLQVCDLSFFSCIHYWLHRLLVEKLKLPSFPLNLYFVAFFTLTMGFSIYDFENTRQNMQTILYSTLKAYIIGIGGKHYSVPLYQINGEPSHSETGLNIAITSIRDCLAFWAPCITMLVLFFLGCFTLILLKINVLYHSVYRNKKEEDYDEFTEMTEKVKRSWRKHYQQGYRISDDIWTPHNKYLNPFFIATHVLGTIYFTIMMIMIFGQFENKLQFFSYLPYWDSILLTITHFEKRPTNKVKDNLINTTRSYLPKGRYWLDNRGNIEFPAVHADKTVYCSYNPIDHKTCDEKPSPTPEPIQDIPNVVVLVYESFNPSTYLINIDYLEEHVRATPHSSKYLITDTGFYNPEVMPRLAKLAKEGITFAGMNSHGLPTFSGWHSLMTGVPPSQTYMNIIDGYKMHVDDLPSHLRDEGYRTFFISAQPFDFDGMRNWVYRRSALDEAKIKMKCDDAYGDLADDPIQMQLAKDMKIQFNKCDPKKINELALKYKDIEFPQWFDYLATFYPTKSQAKVLNISEETLKYRYWTNDRVTSKQFQTIWKQQRNYLMRNNMKKPIFGTYLSVDAHMPYEGYDLESFYNPKMPKELKWGSNETKILKFKRVNKYADEHFIGDTIEYLKKNDPNTIVFITGDHGTRDIPVRSKNTMITDDIAFSDDCIGESSGVDSFFTVSGALLYLGNNSRVKEVLKLNKLAGKTLKMATDHNDLTFTIFDIISKLKAKPLMPTHKRGRNLIDLGEEALEKDTQSMIRSLDESGWQSISFLSHQMDYRKGAKYLRTHSSDRKGAHYYDAVSFPTCLKLKGEEKREKINNNEMFDDMFQFLDTENYLMSMNQLYNYKFRDIKCIENHNCVFPGHEKIKCDDGGFWIAIIGFPSLVMISVSFLIMGPIYFLDSYKTKCEDGLTNDIGAIHEI